MSLKARVGSLLNPLLEKLNLRVVSLTAERLETLRLLDLEKGGQFREAAFPVLPSFEAADPAPLLKQVRTHSNRFEQFRSDQGVDGFWLPNGYFETPDAEILYSMIQLARPEVLIEVGSGNSTWLSRIAIRDAGLGTRLISIDPNPRRELRAVPDEIYAERVEKVDPALFDALGEGDILFIDSSHEVRTGNDVISLYLQILPRLVPGVLVHIHDIFLPYDYPREWVVDMRWGWNEQYLVQGILAFGEAFEVLWPGHFLQRVRTDFSTHFPEIGDQLAKSLWLRKKR